MSLWFSIDIFNLTNNRIGFFFIRNLAFNWLIGVNSICLWFFWNQKFLIQKVYFDMRGALMRRLNLKLCEHLEILLIIFIVISLFHNYLLSWISFKCTLSFSKETDAFWPYWEYKIGGCYFSRLVVKKRVRILVPGHSLYCQLIVIFCL